MLSEKEKAELLKRHTNMTEKEIKKHMQNGVYFYANNEAGYKEYLDECIAGLNDAEEVPEMWKALDTVGDYRVNFIL